MEAIDLKCSVALVIGAILVLAVNYDFLSADFLSFSIGSVSIASIKANGLMFPVSAIAILSGCGLCHIRHIWPVLFNSYSQAYKTNAGVVSLVRSEVAAAAQDGKYGAPYGGLHGSFMPTEQSLGQFIRPDGSCSPAVVICLKGATHWKALLCGLRGMLGRQLWLGGYGPIILGLWALLTINI